MQGRQRDAGVTGPLEEADDGVLPAVAELAAGMAVSHDFLGQPRVRHDGETEMDEVPGGVRERAELVEARDRRPSKKFVNQAAAHAEAPRVAADDQRAHFGHRAAQRRQFRAREDLAVLDGDDEAMGVHNDLAKLTRQQVSLSEVLDDQFVNGPYFAYLGGAEHDRLELAWRTGIGARSPGIKNWQIAIKNRVALNP
jgi:hypothetical protein